MLRSIFGEIFSKKPTAQDYVQGLAEAVASRVIATPIETTPYPYLFIEQIFPEKFYAELEAALQEARSLFKEQINHGHHSNYSDRSEFKVALTGDKATPDVPEIWFMLLDVLFSAPFVAAVKQRFSQPFREKLGSLFDDKRCRDFIDPSLMVTKHRANYYLGPHTDRREKILTCVFNFPTRDDVEEIGTSLYTPKKAGFISDGTKHLDPQDFNFVKTTPFRRNSALIFARLDDSFHGVERLTPEHLKGDERFNVQFNIWDWGRRPQP